MPQPPQLAASLLRFVSQPLPPGTCASPLQSSYGAVQLEMPHFPSLHAGVPPPAGQTLPHTLQLSALTFKSVSQPSVRPFLQSSRPGSQAMLHLPALQLALPPFSLHLLLQLPQVAGVERSASQPFLASPSQLSKPASQLVTLQTPASHFSLAWSSAQLAPQAPQSLSDDATSVSQPFFGSASQSK